MEYDLNQDGIVSKEEILEVMVGRHMNNIKEKWLVNACSDANEMFVRADENKDGVVSFEEFCNVQGIYNAHDIASIRGSFDHFDVNKDGSLQNDEFNNWYINGVFLGLMATF